MVLVVNGCSSRPNLFEAWVFHGLGRNAWETLQTALIVAYGYVELAYRSSDVEKNTSLAEKERAIEVPHCHSMLRRIGTLGELTSARHSSSTS